MTTANTAAKDRELVLCIPAADFAPLEFILTSKGGFSPSLEQIRRILDRPIPKFVPRGECEGNDTYKQVIPYVVFVHEPSTAPPMVLRYRRSATGGDARLHDRYSIGIGGHTNIDDLKSSPNGFAPDVVRPQPGPGSLAVHQAMRREIREEVAIIGAQPQITPVGVIYDDSDAVGRDHVGILYIAEMQHLDIGMRDESDEAVSCEWSDLENTADDSMESWSRIVVERFLRPRWAFLRSPS